MKQPVCNTILVTENTRTGNELSSPFDFPMEMSLLNIPLSNPYESVMTMTNICSGEEIRSLEVPTENYYYPHLFCYLHPVHKDKDKCHQYHYGLSSQAP